MKRIVFLIFGILCALLGVIGVILPVMPGIIFFVAAAYFFSHSSNKLHMALYRIPYIGKSVKEWESSKTMNSQAKLTVVFLFFGMAFYPFFLYENKASGIILANIFIIVLFTVLAIRPPKKTA